MENKLSSNEIRTLMQFRRSSYNDTLKKFVMRKINCMEDYYLNNEADEEKRKELVIAKEIYQALFEEPFQ